MNLFTASPKFEANPKWVCLLSVHLPSSLVYFFCLPIAAFPRLPPLSLLAAARLPVVFLPLRSNNGRQDTAALTPPPPGLSGGVAVGCVWGAGCERLRLTAGAASSQVKARKSGSTPRLNLNVCLWHECLPRQRAGFSPALAPKQENSKREACK